MMTLSEAGLRLIQQFEGCRLEAYLDTGGLPTIGWGATRWPDGRRVQLGEACSQDQADNLLRHDVAATARAVDDLTVDTIRPEQFEALVSFAFNVGVDAFRRSTLRQLVNLNPDNPAIREQFLRWSYDNGQFVRGLRARREREAAHYFGGV
ncbi:MAG: lysozyme [Gemmatimonadota bacterium]|nr:lysozyme [Gemmatimonadota bacterium]